MELLELLALFEAGIVIFPLGPGTAESSSESNCDELLRLIAAPVVFPFATVRLPLFPLPPPVAADETFAPGKFWVPALAVPLEEGAAGAIPNVGAFPSGCVVAPLPPNVPVVLPLPPDPV
jgi:hypothetical protein